jgi:hypothetical protein
MFKHILGLALATSLVACTTKAPAPQPETSTPAEPVSEQPVAPAPTETAAPAGAESSTVAALPPNDYCYAIGTDDLSGALRLTIDAAGQVQGNASVSISNEEEGYFTSYFQNFAGALTADVATVDVMTWIEYDLQNTTETWIVSDAQLLTDNQTFRAVNCEDAIITDSFTGIDEGAELLAGLPAGQRVQFAPGTTGTVLENSVVRGDRDLYLLQAEGGQAMALNIASLEDNAVFDVVSPTGFVMAREVTETDLFLSERGDYRVIVGGTRGNATYSLNVSIE